MGNTVYDFKSCDKLGRIGEAVAESYFNSLDTVKISYSVRNQKEFQAKDIDLIVEREDSNTYSVEVKTDSYISGNMFYETYSDVMEKKLGCLEISEADYLFYYFINPSFRSAYIFDIKELRNWVNEHKVEYKPKRVLNKGFISEGYALPLERLVADLKSIDVIDLNCLENIEWFEEQGRSYWDKKKKSE